MKKIVGTGTLLVLVWSLITVAHAQEKKEKAENESKTIEVFVHMDLLPNFETRFYMWIGHPHILVRNTAPDLDIGYSFGHGAALYIETKKPSHLNAMCFITTPEKGNWRTVEVWFGGSRPNDIHIVLPEGYTAKTWTNVVTISEKEWKRRQEDEAEQKGKDTQ